MPPTGALSGGIVEPLCKDTLAKMLPCEAARLFLSKGLRGRGGDVLWNGAF